MNCETCGFDGSGYEDTPDGRFLNHKCIDILRTRLAESEEKARKFSDVLAGEVAHLDAKDAKINRLTRKVAHVRRVLDSCKRIASGATTRADKAERERDEKDGIIASLRAAVASVTPTPCASYWMIEAISDGPARWWSTLLGWCADAASADHYATKTDAEKAMHAKILAGVLTHEPNAALMKVTEHIDMESISCEHGHVGSMDDPECLPCRDRKVSRDAIERCAKACDDKVKELADGGQHAEAMVAGMCAARIRELGKGLRF